MYLYTVELERVYLYSVRKGQTAVARDRGLYELEKSRRRLYMYISHTELRVFLTFQCAKTRIDKNLKF